jgi:GNAT superfamily N-acetyltransferase
MLGAMPSTSFRELEAADIAEVAALVVRCDELTGEWMPGFQLPDGHAEREVEIWREDFANQEFRAQVACDPEGTIVGVVGTDGWHVASLFVEPRLHGQGLGSRLLARAEAWTQEAGHERATLNVLEGSPAMRFYERNGWTRDGRRKLYEAFDMPTVGYEKRFAAATP